MNQKKSLRRYAKKPLGTYPEVDKFILHDPKAKYAEQRYLVDGEHFAQNLTRARELVAQRLGLNDPKVTAATEVHYTPATGFKILNRKTKSDEGEQNMGRRGPQSLEVAQGKLDLAKKDLEATKARTPASDSPEDRAALQTAIGKAEDRVKYQERAVKAAEAGMTVKQFERRKDTGNKEVIKPAQTKPSQNKPVQQRPVQQPTTQSIIPPAPMAEVKPMMIEAGGIKITVNSAEQMDLAIGSLKKHGAF